MSVGILTNTQAESDVVQLRMHEEVRTVVVFTFAQLIFCVNALHRINDAVCDVLWLEAPHGQSDDTLTSVSLSLTSPPLKANSMCNVFQF